MGTERIYETKIVNWKKYIKKNIRIYKQQSWHMYK